ncbi:DUF6538 domain-containing protein [Bradyrhizobium sp. AUGA SZCCT0182]|uniref:DUF6538 domain-containing protein n=1 Tax=Bradyrhizobium sp. AUGA SZCCT0182 TaxID=2807667 RepID=UPI00390C582F
MGLIKDRHGTYCAQQKVPERLQPAVAKVLGNGKARQVYLKKSLGTKDLKAANIRGKLVLAGFDRIMRDVTAIAEQPSVAPSARSSLNDTEIARMAEYVFAKALAWDERFRVGGREELKRVEAWLHTSRHRRLGDLRDRSGCWQSVTPTVGHCRPALLCARAAGHREAQRWRAC